MKHSLFIIISTFIAICTTPYLQASGPQNPTVVIYNTSNTENSAHASPHVTLASTQQQAQNMATYIQEKGTQSAAWLATNKKKLLLYALAMGYGYALYTAQKAIYTINHIESLSMWNHETPTLNLVQQDHSVLTQELIYMIQEKYLILDPARQPQHLFLADIHKERQAAHLIITWYETCKPWKCAWMLGITHAQYEHAKNSLTRLNFMYKLLCSYTLQQQV